MTASDAITRLNAALEGRYRVERQLGEGGMATVYLADDLRHERKVALKVLKPELAAVVGAERFLAEIKTTANLQHPHILPLFDSGEADSFLFYVMPYVEGESLRERLDREHQLPVDEAVQIAKNVAEALDYAHRQGVIHRDIKPANILLQDGKPVVSDFGIALAVTAGGAGRLTETGLSLGTPHYMSPEQATGDLSVGAATDIYALGCVLYEMLVGEPPYTGSTPQAVLGKIVTGEADPVTKYRRSVPPNVDATIRKALEKVPADRFLGASDFARALMDPSFGYSQAAGTGAATSAGPWKSVSLATSALAAAAMAVAAWALMRPSPTSPVSWYPISLPEDQAFAPSDAAEGTVDLSPDGRRFVYVGSEPGGGTRLWLRPRDQMTASAIPGTDGAANPSFSPDGSKLAFTLEGSPRRLMVATIGGGPPLTLTDSLVDPGGVSWGDDGYIYYDAHLAGDGIARISALGGRPEQATEPRNEDGELYHNAPYALPGSRGLLFQVQTGAGQDIAVLDPTTHEHRILVRGAVRPFYSPTGHLVYVTRDGTLTAAPFDIDRLALTGEPVTLADGVRTTALGAAATTLADDGTLMYGAGGTNQYELVWVTRTGEVSVIDPDGAPSDIESLALSPDGARLAFTVTATRGEGSQVWVKELGRTGARRLTIGGTSFDPTWTPDSRAISFLSDREGGLALYRRLADQSAPAEALLNVGSQGVQIFTYSRDGRWLVYQTLQDLYGVRLDSTGVPEGEPLPLATHPFNEIHARVSPNGRWLAYFGGPTGRSEIYVCPFPVTCDQGRLVSTDGGRFPAWSHDGRELFYIDLQGRFMAVEVRPGETFEWEEARELFDASDFRESFRGGNYAVSPDDQHFIFARAVGGGRGAQLVVVENFFQVLKEQVPS